MKIVRYVLYAMGGAAVAAAGVGAFLAATFDPNEWKPGIIRYIKEQKQRTLQLDGDIRLVLWPTPGAAFGHAALSEAGDEQEFAAFESARVSLKLMPLLSGRIVIDDVVVTGARVRLVRFRDGRTNIDDLLVRDATPDAFKVDIGRATIDGASLTIRDEATGAQYALSGIKLRAARIADGATGSVAFSADVRGYPLEVDVRLEGRAEVAIDARRQNLALSGLTLDARGTGAGLAGLALQVRGDVSVALAGAGFATRRMVISLSGTNGADRVELRVDAPALDFVGGRATAALIGVAARKAGPDGATAINFSVSALEGTAQMFRAAELSLDVDHKQRNLAVKARVVSPVEGSVERRQVQLSRLAASVDAAGSAVPARKLRGDLTGAAIADFMRESVEARLAGKVADSKGNLQVSVAGFGSPAVTFNADIDRLNLDRYRDPRSASSPSQWGKPLDLPELRTLRASGSVRIGSLIFSDVRASNVRFDLKAGAGRVEVGPLSNSPAGVSPSGPGPAAQRDREGGATVRSPGR